MAYKRISPISIIEGGTNNKVMSFTNGTVIYDGTKLNSIDPSTSGYVLTSFGAGVTPSFQPSSGSGASWVASGGGPQAVISSFVTAEYNVPNFIGNASANPDTVIFPMPFSCMVSNLYVYVWANTSTINVFCNFNVNKSPTTLTVTVPSLTTGTFSDTTHSVFVAAGSLIQLAATQTGIGGQVVNGQFAFQITP